MAWNFEKVNAYVNRLVRDQLFSKFVTARPLFYFIAGRSSVNFDLLMRARKNPVENWKAGGMLGGSGMTLAQRKRTLGSLSHELRYQTDDPTSATNVGPGGATPAATVFSEDLVGTAGTRWTSTMWPLKVRQSTIDANKGSTAISSVMSEALAMSFNLAQKNTQTDFWSSTLTQAQQNKDEWEDGILGLTHWVDDGSTYQYVGRVDRTTGTGVRLKANVYSAANLKSNGQMATTRPTLNLIRTLNTQDNVAGGTNTGLRNFDPDAGDLVITTSALWNVLANEADGEHTIYDDGKAIPGLGMSVGFKYPVIKKDNSYITYDPDCPSGEMNLLSTNTFCWEVQPGYNFKIEEWQKDWLTTEAGGWFQRTLIMLKHRFTCERPWLNTRVTGLST